MPTPTADLPLTEGTTGNLDFPLLQDGAAPDLTGCSAALLLKTKAGSLVTLSGTVTIPTPTSGVVRYAPGAGDLLAANSPYAARFRITDAGGKIRFFPEGGPGMIWEVSAQ